MKTVSLASTLLLALCFTSFAHANADANSTKTVYGESPSAACKIGPFARTGALNEAKSVALKDAQSNCHSEDEFHQGRLSEKRFLTNCYAETYQTVFGYYQNQQCCSARVEAKCTLGSNDKSND